jgi:hypothetical protein
MKPKTESSEEFNNDKSISKNKNNNMDMIINSRVSAMNPFY